MKIKIPDNIEQLKENNWLSITVQSSLLGFNFLLISQSIINSYILISVILIFSLFLLQVASHRFRYLNPINKHVQVYTPHVDTFLLYLFIFLSGVFLFFGISLIYDIAGLKSADAYLKDYILWMLGVIVFILPLLFYFFGRSLITKSITKKLKTKKFQYIDICVDCGKAGALYENIVYDWNDLRIRKTCQHCNDGKTKEYKTNLVIG